VSNLTESSVHFNTHIVTADYIGYICVEHPLLTGAMIAPEKA
jgi:hypothetical protein